MILKTLPHNSTHAELFFKYKHAEEQLGELVLDKSDLDFDTIHSLQRDVTEFNKTGINLKVIWSQLELNTPSYIKYQTHLENYVKAVWLTKDYIINSGFKNPIGVHWNLKLKKWNIHPGGSRQKILHLFEKQSIKTIAFNTSGIEVQFQKVFNNLKDISNYYSSEDIFLTCVADYGSLVPHVHFDQNSILVSVEKQFNSIKKFYKRANIQANFDLTKWGYTPPVNYKFNVTITVEDPLNNDNIIRAFLLLPSFTKFNDHGVKIERT
jgi:hypothetical protein